MCQVYTARHFLAFRPVHNVNGFHLLIFKLKYLFHLYIFIKVFTISQLVIFMFSLVSELYSTQYA